MLQNFLKVIFSDFFKLVVSFSTLIILTNVLSTENFGIYGTILAYSSLFSLIALNTSNNKIIINLTNELNGISKSLFKKIFLIRSFFTILTFCLLYLINIILNLNIDEYYFSICLIISSIVLWDFSESIFFAKLNFNYPIVISIFFSLLWLISIYFFADEISFFQLIVVYASIYLIRSFVIFLFSFKFLENIIYNQNISSKRILKLSFPYVIMRILAGIAEHSPVILLGFFISSSEVAFYHLGNRITLPFIIIFGAILKTLYPYMSKSFISDKDKIEKIISEIYAPIYLFFSFIIFLLSISSSYWIPTIFGDEYNSVIDIFNFLAWIILFFSFDLLMSNILSTFNMQNKLGLITFVDFIIVMPFIYIGSQFGSEFLSQLKLVAYFITFNFHLYMLNKLVKLKILNKKFIFSYILVFLLLIMSLLKISLLLKISFLVLCLALSTLIFWNDSVKILKFFYSKYGF